MNVVLAAAAPGIADGDVALRLGWLEVPAPRALDAARRQTAVRSRSRWRSIRPDAPFANGSRVNDAPPGAASGMRPAASRVPFGR